MCILSANEKIFFNQLHSDGKVQKLELYTLNERHDKVIIEKEIPSDIQIHGYEKGFYNLDTNEEKNVFVRDFILYNNLFLIANDPVGESVHEPLPTDLEVVYIGQAFGRNADRTIDYRLVNHEKIQK
jgi:hypothetical protein